jgi:hypothetical protein
MGFVPPTTGVKLEFEGTQYEGLEVTMDSVSTGTVLDIMDQFETAKDGDPAALRVLLDGFSVALESWNIEDRKSGQPVPATIDGLRTLDFTLAMAVIGAWIGSVASAPPPLPGSSPSGSPSPEGPIPALAALSSSLPS